MANSVIGLGAGGHAKVVIEILQLDDRFQLVGLLDQKPELEEEVVLGVKVLGNDERLPELARDLITHFFVGVGSIGNTVPRRKLFELGLSHGLRPVTAVHPQAVLSPSAVLNEGVTVMATAVINACAVLGKNAVANTGAIIEHGCRIGDHVFIATGAQLASSVNVERGAHIGAGATIRQCITVGQGALVGAGAVVVEDVPPRTVVAGVPARPLQAPPALD